MIVAQFDGKNERRQADRWLEARREEQRKRQAQRDGFQQKREKPRAGGAKRRSV